MAYYATARIFADPFGSFLEGQRAAYDDVRKQQELLRRMYETYLNERRVELGYAELGYKYDSLGALQDYRQNLVDLEREKLELEKNKLNQPSSMESYLRMWAELNGLTPPGGTGTPKAPTPPKPKPAPQAAPAQSAEPEPTKPLPMPKKRLDRIPIEPPVTAPPTTPQSALPPINGAPQAAPATQRAIGGFTLPERAAQQLQQAPPTTPVPNPLAAYRDVKERQQELPEPVPPPTGGFTGPPANRPPGGRKYVYDRIPAEAPAATAQRTAPAVAAQNTEKVAASVQRLLSLRQEIIKQLQNPNIDPKGKRALAAALARVDFMLLRGRNAR